MRLLVAESSSFSSDARALLSSNFDARFEDLDRPALLREVGEAEILWVRLRHRIDEEVFDAAPALRAVVTNTTGLNHIDLACAERRHVRVLSLRGETHFLRTVRATAEHALGLAIALIRHIPDAAWHTVSGEWDRDLFRGNELYGKTAAVVGYGRLGRLVARYLQALEMTVIAVEPDPSAAAAAAQAGVTCEPLEEALRRADLVSLHVDLRAETVGMFDVEAFAAMKPGAWFVNTARGELVDERALLSALESGRIAGAALDVLCNEDSAGMADHPLVRYAASHKNLILTPHIGGNTPESGHRTEIFLAEKLVEAFRSGGLESGE